MFRTILVDDERMTLISTEHSFPWRKYGFFVSEKTTDPRTALQLLQEQQFDAAFLDIRMPGLSGLDIVRLCRENGSTTEFIVISGYTDYAYMKQAVQLGAFDYCQKPVQALEAERLLEKLATRLAQNHRSGDIRLLEQFGAGSSLRQIFTCFGLSMGEEPAAVVLIRLADAAALLLEPVFEQEAPAFLLSDTDILFLLPAKPDNLEALPEQIPALAECRIAYGVVDGDASQLLKLVERLRTEIMRTSGELPVVRTMMTRPDEAFEALLDYVNAHHTEDLSLRSLSEQFHLNYTYCSELFKSATGVNFSKYLTGLRMNTACRLLATTEKSVATVCQLAGYNSFHHFAGVFKSNFGLTPTEYRQKRERGI